MIADIAADLLRERHNGCGRVVTHETWNGSTVIEIDDLIMKVNDHPSASAEEMITTKVRSAGGLAPEIIDRGWDARFPGGRWIIMRRVPGRPWDASAATASEAATVLDQVSRQLLIMRSITLPGYGWISPDGHGTSPSWTRWLREQVTARTDLLASRLTAGFSTGAIEAIDAIAPASLDGSILHGDLGLSHVFVDPDTHRLTALIDWSNAVIGDPLYDLATFSMGGPAGDPIQDRLQPQLVDRYRRRLGSDSVDEKRLQLYRMIHHLNNACWSVDNHVDSWTADLCAAAEELLRRLQA